MRDTSHWTGEVAAAVERTGAAPPTGRVGSEALEARPTGNATVPLAADDPIYANVPGGEDAAPPSDAFEALAVVNTIRDVLWRVGDAHRPDKEWEPDTLEYIADILTGAGLGPVPKKSARDLGSLDDQRQQAAEDAFASYDLGDVVVSDTSGWEHCSGEDEWSRVFFVEDPPGPSVRELFVVRFKPRSAEVKEAYWSC
ncbi:MAG TPA: hypothetical protein VEL76_39475 [Gemmataceae bacterium]|nr:hypothetical protein [Gemmataceae bacterium]